MSGPEITGAVYCTSVKFQIADGKTRGPRAEDKEGQYRVKKSKKGKEEPETAPEFVVRPRRQFVDFGQNAKFKASFDGSSNTTLSWSKDETVLVADDHFKIYEQDGYHYLEVCDVTVGDNGWYTCTVSNPTGSDTASADMEVFEKPQLLSRSPMPVSKDGWAQPLSNLTTYIGDELLNMTCISKGVVKPSVKWLHNGREIFSGFHMTTTHEGQKTVLTIKKIQERDAGEFKCVMTGTNGELETSCVLTVNPAEKFEPPVFVKELHDMEVTDGDKLELVVEVKGTSPIRVFWFHNDEEVHQDNPDFLLASLGCVHTLTLPRASVSCAGQFVCEAYNECGDTDTFCLIHFREVECPELPSFVTRPLNLSTHEDESVTFTCKVQGQPLPSVSWEKGGVEITSSHKHKTSQEDEGPHSLTIYNVDATDTGEYTCHLYNTLGDASHIFYLHLVGEMSKSAMNYPSMASSDSLAADRLKNGMEDSRFSPNKSFTSIGSGSCSRSSVKKYQRNSILVEFGTKSDCSKDVTPSDKFKDTYTGRYVTVDRNNGDSFSKQNNFYKQSNSTGHKSDHNSFNENSDVVSNGLRSLQMERNCRNVLSRTNQRTGVPERSSTVKDKVASGSQTHRDYTYHRTPHNPVTTIGLRALNKSLSTIGKDGVRTAMAFDESQSYSPRLSRQDKAPAYSPSSSLQVDSDEKTTTASTEGHHDKMHRSMISIPSNTSESRRMERSMDSKSSLLHMPLQTETTYRPQMVYKNHTPHAYSKDEKTKIKTDDRNESNSRNNNSSINRSYTNRQDYSNTSNRPKPEAERKSSLTKSGSVFAWDKSSSTTTAKEAWNRSNPSSSSLQSDRNEGQNKTVLRSPIAGGEKSDQFNHYHHTIASNLKGADSEKHKLTATTTTLVKDELHPYSSPSSSSSSFTQHSSSSSFTPQSSSSFITHSAAQNDFRSVKLRPAAAKKGEDRMKTHNRNNGEFENSKYMSQSTDNIFSKVKLKPVANALPNGRDNASLSRNTGSRFRLKSKSSDNLDCSVDSQMTSSVASSSSSSLTYTAHAAEKSSAIDTLPLGRRNETSVKSTISSRRYGDISNGSRLSKYGDKKDSGNSGNIASHQRCTETSVKDNDSRIYKYGHEKDSVRTMNNANQIGVPDKKHNNSSDAIRSQKSDLMDKIRQWKTSPDWCNKSETSPSTVTRKTTEPPSAAATVSTTSNYSAQPSNEEGSSHLGRVPDWIKQKALNKRNSVQLDSSRLSTSLKFQLENGNEEKTMTKSANSELFPKKGKDERTSALSLSQTFGGLRSPPASNSHLKTEKKTFSALPMSSSYSEKSKSDIKPRSDVKPRSDMFDRIRDTTPSDTTLKTDSKLRSDKREQTQDSMSGKDFKYKSNRYETPKDTTFGKELKYRSDKCERAKGSISEKQNCDGVSEEGKSMTMDPSVTMDTSWINRQPMKNIEKVIQQKALDKTKKHDEKPDWTKARSPREIKLGNFGLKANGDKSAEVSSRRFNFENSHVRKTDRTLPSSAESKMWKSTSYIPNLKMGRTEFDVKPEQKAYPDCEPKSVYDSDSSGGVSPRCKPNIIKNKNLYESQSSSPSATITSKVSSTSSNCSPISAAAITSPSSCVSSLAIASSATDLKTTRSTTHSSPPSKQQTSSATTTSTALSSMASQQDHPADKLSYTPVTSQQDRPANKLSYTPMTSQQDLPANKLSNMPMTKSAQLEGCQKINTVREQPSMRNITSRPSWMKSKSLRHIPIYPIQDNELSPRYEPFRPTPTLDDSSSTISTTSVSSLASDTSNFTTDSGYGKSVGAVEQISTLSLDSFDEKMQASMCDDSQHDTSNSSISTLTLKGEKEVPSNSRHDEDCQKIDDDSILGSSAVPVASCDGTKRSCVSQQSIDSKLSNLSTRAVSNETSGKTSIATRTSAVNKRVKDGSSMQSKDEKRPVKEEESSDTITSAYSSVRTAGQRYSKSKLTPSDTSVNTNDAPQGIPRTARSEFLRNRLDKEALVKQQNNNQHVSMTSSASSKSTRQIPQRPTNLDLSAPKEPRIKTTDVRDIVRRSDDDDDNENDDDDSDHVFTRNAKNRRSMETKSSFSRNSNSRLSCNAKLGGNGGEWSSKSERLRNLAARQSKETSDYESSAEENIEDVRNSSKLVSSIARKGREASLLNVKSLDNHNNSSKLNASADDETRETTDQKRSTPESFPSFVTPLSDVSVLYGSKAVLKCHLTGKPSPEVHWLHDRNPIEASKDYDIHYSKLTNTAQLTVVETFTDHIGTYTCVATNALGSVCSSGRVTIETSNKSEGLALEGPVSVPPRVVSLKPKIATLTRRSTLTLTLTFVGEPLPAVKWFQGEKELTNDARVNIITLKGTSVLSITEVSAMDSGNISATVTSSIGTDQSSVDVCVEDVPGAPAGVPHVYDISRDSASLSWCGPVSSGGTKVTYYVIEAKTRKQTVWDVLVQQCKELSHHIFGLESGCTYQFRVRAANKEGLGPPSEPSEKVITADMLTASMTESDDELPFEPREVTINATDTFENLYDIGQVLGKGKFGIVYQCTQKSNGSTWAAKVLKCRGREKAAITQEIDIMNRLHHPKLLMLWDAFESARQMVLVMEYIGAGELFERVIGEDFVLTERDCVHFLRQINEGVSFMHSSNVLHLDLKPENILCISESTNRIKIIDFGLARVFKPGDSVKVMFGTPEFIAPEVINYDEIGCATDMWSVGVICYVLLSGLSPFLGDNDMETLSNVTSGEFDFEDEAFDEISDVAKDFISKLLIKKKEKRLLTHDCLAHEWLNTDEVDGARYKRLNTDRLRHFMVRRKWLRTGKAVMAVSRLLKSSSLGSLNSSRAENSSSTDDLSETPRSPSLNNVVEENGTTSKESEAPSSDDEQIERMKNSEISNQSPNTNISVDDKKDCLSTDQNDNKIKDHSNGVTIRTKGNTEDGDLGRNNNSSINHNNNISTITTTTTTTKLESSSAQPEQSVPSSSSAFTNGVKSDAQNSISVSGCPVFTRTMLDCQAFAGDVVRFDVVVTGEPAPEVSWYFEEDLINSTSKYSLEKNVAKGTNSLIIRSIEEDDEGEYFCKARNSLSEVVCSAELSVLVL